MGRDDREKDGDGVLIVPKELVTALIESTLETMAVWHEKNSVEPDMLVACGALTTMAHIVTEELMEFHNNPRTLQ
jgi:hypothetical protein